MIQRRALILALLAGAAIVVGVALAWKPSRTQVPATIASTPAPDIKDLPQPMPGTATALGAGEGFFVQFVDRDDPTRLGGEITADASTPLASGRYELREPRAWFFLRDGRSVHVRAERGTMTPGEHGGQPRDGDLAGSVRVRMFSPRPAGDRPDAERDAHVGELRTPRLVVDWANGRVDMDTDFTFASPRLSGDGAGLSAEFDPVAQRLDGVTVRHMREVVYRPAQEEAPAPIASAPGTPPAPPASTARPLATGGSLGTPPSADRTQEGPGTRAATERAADSEDLLASPDMFWGQATGDVVVTQGERVVRADRAEVWTRTQDGANRARDDAPRDSRATRGTSGPTPIATPLATPNTLASEPDAARQSQTDSPRSSPDASAIRMTWSGPLEVRRLQQEPSELTRERLALRLHARAGARVQLSEGTIGAEGATFTYRRAHQRFELTGDEISPAIVRAVNAGSCESDRFEVDLARGVAVVPGPGVLRAHKSAATSNTNPTTPPTDTPGEATLSWREQAEFGLTGLDGAPQGQSSRESLAIRDATFIGSVRGEREGAGLEAQQVKVVFGEQPDPTTGARATRVRSVDAVGGARAFDARGSSLSGDAIAATFDPESTLGGARVQVIGRTVATVEGDVLRADDLVADLATRDETARDPRPRDTSSPAPMGASVVRVDATGNVRFEGKDQTIATGQRVIALPATRDVEILGAGDTPARLERAGASAFAPRLRLLSSAGQFLAEGKGELHAVEGGASEGDAATTSARALAVAWERELVYDERSREATARGSVVATASRPREQDSLRADEVVLRFAEEPLAKGPPSDDPPAEARGKPADEPSRDRALARGPSGGRLAWARAIATGDAPVRALLTRGETRPETDARLTYLESRNVTLEVAKGEASVEGPGRLLNSSRRTEADRTTPQPPGGLVALAGAGDALFTWKGGMDLRRIGAPESASEVQASLREGVRLVHRAAPDSPVTELECGLLVARLASGEEPGDAATGVRAPSAGALRSVEASAGVWAKSGGGESRELSGDSLTYDPIARLIDAWGKEGAPVSVVVTSQNVPASPITAARVRWDLGAGRIDVVDPGTFSAPR
jgi:lipopolysaccharide export system protein LptA